MVDNTKANNTGQKYLGNVGLIALITFLSAFTPLSMDLYLPALPGMTEYFHTSINLINMTLIVFFVFFSLGTLFWGPLSDKYGRRPVLLAGLFFYTISSFLCAFSQDVYQLIVFRALQAIGGGSAVAISMAIIKDVYEERKSESAMAVVQSLYFIAPATGPIVGAFILNYTSWRGVFGTMCILGIIALAGTFALTETIAKRSSSSILSTLGRLGVIIKNPGFLVLLIIFSVAMLPTGAYIASSSFIYVDGFNLSEQSYSFFFALNSICLMIGSMLYIPLSRKFKRNSIITVSLLFISFSGLMICFLGRLHPWIFALALIPGTITGSIIRPPSAILMLQQQAAEDTGSASSLINSARLLTGSIGMVIISFDSHNLIMLLGILNLTVGLICAVSWIYTANKPFIKQVSQANF